MTKYYYTFFSIGLILFLLGLSLLTPGGFFVLDFVITPFTLFHEWQSTTLQWHMVHLLNYLFGYTLTSKLYYIFVLGFGCYTGGKLGNLLHKLLGLNSSKWVIQVVTAIFLLCNPWVYERFITQPGIALGIFCITLGIHYLVENVLIPKDRSLIWAALSFGFAFMCFPHASVMILVVGVLYVLLFIKHIPWKIYFIAPLLIILPNINWLIGDIFFGENLGTTSLQSFDWDNIQGFVGNNLSGLGSELTQVLLYGFWGEKYHIKTPDMFSEYWYIFGYIILGIIIYGNIKLFKLHTRLWLYLSLLGTITLILSIGINSDIFGGINVWLYENIPGYIGMREPQKWLGITMIVYTICFIIGIVSLWKSLSWMKPGVFILLVFVLLNTWNPMNMFAYQGQLFGIIIPKHYRDLALKQYSSDSEGKYLVLPWHTYMSCDWTKGKNIASMQAQHFYPLDTVVADNIEIDTKYSNSSSQTSKNVESYLGSKNYNFLEKEGITHIIYQKDCAHMPSWEYLNEDESLKLIQENDYIALYTIVYEK